MQISARVKLPCSETSTCRPDLQSVMSDPLATYLHDHLAGSHFAIKLLETVREQYSKESLAGFAEALITDVKDDQETLQGIIERVGKAHLDWTETAGWFAEKASQLKLQRDDTEAGIGTFEALETLAVGIRGKLALWQVLPIIRKVDPRIPDIDYGKLAERAEEQFARVEKRRLESALITFRPDQKKSVG
jgi:hypothetical protein